MSPLAANEIGWHASAGGKHHVDGEARVMTKIVFENGLYAVVIGVDVSFVGNHCTAELGVFEGHDVSDVLAVPIAKVGEACDSMGDFAIDEAPCGGA